MKFIENGFTYSLIEKKGVQIKRESERKMVKNPAKFRLHTVVNFLQHPSKWVWNSVNIHFKAIDRSSE